jgi:glycosyltransferase involved in cell wall biosynthesis
LIKHLDADRIQSTVACILDDDSPELPLIDECRRLGFQTLVLDGRRSRVGEPVISLRRTLRDHSIQVIHSHGTRQDLVALLARRGLPCSVVSTPHGWAHGVSARAWLYDALDWALLPFCDAVAPLSPGLRDSLRWLPIPSRRVRLIPNSVDLDEVSAAKPFANGLPTSAAPGTPVIGFIGQLIPRKGVDVLLRALALIRDEIWQCVLLGEGPEQRDLENLSIELGIDSRVFFLGFQSNRLRYLKHFDLFVIPSYREGMPRALLEALAAGVPCVGAHIPGIQELLENGVTGFTVPPGNSGALARALSAGISNAELAKRMADAGRDRVLTLHGTGPMARAYEDLYSELCRAS